MSDARVKLSAAIVLFTVLLPLSALGVEATDTSIKPGDDFYGFANNAWLKTTTLQPGQSKYDTTTVLRADTAKRVHDLIAGAASGTQIGDYYTSWLDGAAIEAKGIAPLSGALAEIAAIKDRQELSAYLGGTLRLDDGSDTQPDNILGVFIHQGFHDPDHYVPHIVQGGLGLGDRDVYLSDTPENIKQRADYRAHVVAVLKLAGFADSDARAARVLALERELAKAHASAADTADVFKTDNSWHRGDFDKKAPGLGWTAYFRA